MKSILSRVFGLLSLLALAACETNLGTDNLRILNEDALPTEMTWYQAVDIPIEIVGGQGGYSVRYIQNPESGMTEEEIGDSVDFNDVSLSVIKEQDTQKNTFRLQGTPIRPQNEGDSSSSAYWIEVTDGVSRYITRVEFEISNVVIDDFTTFRTFSEGEANISGIASESRGKVICEETQRDSIEAIDTAFGRAYPAFVLLKLSEEVSVPVTFNVQTVSSGIGLQEASPFVDYIPFDGQLVFRPGDSSCAVLIYLLDDAEIEPRKALGIAFEDAGNIVSSFASVQANIEIRDDEPGIEQFDLEYTVKNGDVVEFEVELTAPANRRVVVPFDIASAETTLDPDDYSVTPGSRVLTIEEEERSGIVSVEISNVLKTTEVDPVLKLEVQGDSFEDPDGTVEIRVNSFNVADFLQISSNELPQRSAFASDSFYLASSLSTGAQESIRIRRFDGLGNPDSLDGGQFYDISAVGQDIVLKELLVSDSSGTIDRLVVVAEASFNLGGTSWGGRDFVIIELEVDDTGVVTQTKISQHGSESDDFVESARYVVNEGLIVTGRTGGSSLDGEAIVAPGIGLEGFVYLLQQDLSIQYRRFIGDASDNSSLAGAITDTGAKVISTGTRGLFVSSFDADGFIDTDIDPVDIPKPAAFRFGGFDNYRDDRFITLVSSQFSSDLVLTPSLSEDVFVYDVDLGDLSNFGNIFQIATDQDDEAIAIANLEEQDVFGVVGETLGEFQTGSSISGIGGRDAFFAVVDYVSTPALGQVTQFGTPGDDFVLDVEAVNDSKFLVLWRENHTSGDGSFRYRITPFAPDGRNLAPLNF